jgi:hypothetical protein
MGAHIEFVSVLPRSSWRFARRRRGAVDVEALGDRVLWAESLRACLANDEGLSLELDSLIGRPRGFHQRISKAADTADTRRRLAYAREVVLSLHLAHHTGRKGGVAAAQLPSVRAATPATVLPEPWWDHVAGCSTELILSTDEGIELTREVLDGYVIAIDARSQVVVPQLDSDVAEEVVTAVVERLGDQVRCTSPTFLTVAIDFMFHANDRPQIIEVHIPGRSIGPAAMAHSLSSACTPGWWLDAVTTPRGIKLIPIPARHLIGEPFHDLDHAFALRAAADLGLGGDPVPWPVEGHLEQGGWFQLGSVGVQSGLLTRSAWSNYLKESLGESVGPHTARVERGDTTALIRALDVVGGWSVVKENSNLPWWHREAHPVRFVAGSSDPQLSRLLRAIDRTDLVVESLIAPSIDSEGRSGEYRVFGSTMFLPN